MFWFRKRNSPSRADFDEFMQLVRDCRRDLQGVRHDLDTLGLQHERLRGYVYARKGREARQLQEQPVANPADRMAWLDAQQRVRKLTKDELRERAGLLPQKPIPQSPVEDDHDEHE